MERLGDIWKNKEKWSEFKTWTRDKCEPEGEDSDGVLLTLDRYLVFLELYVALDSEFRRNPRSENCMNSFLALVNHEEKFFGVERCLKCIDLEMRQDVIKDIKKVKKGDLTPSPEIFYKVYHKVNDKVLELLGAYQNYLISLNTIKK